MVGRLGAPLLGLAFGGVVLVALELSLRALGIAADAPLHDPFAGFSNVVAMFDRVDDVDPPVMRVAPSRLRAVESAGPSRQFLQEPPEDHLRIFVLGGSSAAGVPYGPEFAFSAWLEQRLREGAPGRSLEVVNAALSGYASRRLVPIAREITAYRPDLLIVYMGHNEWAERRYYAHLIELDPRVLALWQRVFSLRLYQVVARALLRDPADVFPRAEPVDIDASENAVEMFGVLRSRAEGDQLATDRDIAYRDLLYEQNLREIARLARGADARTVFVTLSQNFSDWPPGGSRHAASLSADARARWSELRDRASAAARAGRCDEALPLQRQALAIDERFAALHFEVADCERTLGDMEAARTHYRRASDLDTVPQGAPLYFNDIAQRVARETGSLVVDAEVLLQGYSEHALVGNDLFIDQMHPTLFAHQRIGEEVARVLWESGWLGDRAPSPAPPVAFPSPEEIHTRHPEFRTREIELRMIACHVAARSACAAHHARLLLEKDPTHTFAKAIAADGDTTPR